MEISKRGNISETEKEQIRKKSLKNMGNQKGSMIWGINSVAKREQEKILKEQKEYQSNIVNRAEKASANYEAKLEKQQQEQPIKYKTGDKIKVLKEFHNIKEGSILSIVSIKNGEYIITTDDEVITITKKDLDTNFTIIMP